MMKAKNYILAFILALTNANKLSDAFISPIISGLSLSAKISTDESVKRLFQPSSSSVYREDGDSRIIAIGDIHGDLDALHRCLKLANVVDKDGSWSGENTIVVQMGDLIDRGPDDLAVIQTVHRLDREARCFGGRFISLLGNHEVMNLEGEFGFVSCQSFAPFDKLYAELNADLGGDWSAFSCFPEHERCRAAAFTPGGLLSSLLAQHPVVLKIGSTLFVHGGLLPHHALKYSLEEINQLVGAWISGEGPIPNCISKRNSPVWSRSFSAPENEELEDEAKDNLDLVLQLINCDCMVVGHTPQSNGINSAANGKLWRVDTGTSTFYGGKPEVLEIIDGKHFSILTEDDMIPGKDRSCGREKEKDLSLIEEECFVCS